MASNGKAVTGTAVMARSANEEKKKSKRTPCPTKFPEEGWEFFFLFPDIQRRDLEEMLSHYNVR